MYNKYYMIKKQNTQAISSKHILLVEDAPSLSKTYETYLTNQGYRVTPVLTAYDALSFLENNSIDLILLDLKLPDMSGLDLMKTFKNNGYSNAIIVITGNGSINTAVDAMREGARDFLVKPFNVDRLGEAVHKGLSAPPDPSTIAGDKTPHPADSNHHNASPTPLVKSDEDRIQDIRNRQKERSFGGFIGTSMTMQALYTQIENAALSQAPVFITGASGTGKEVCAEAIHKHSNRSNKPFIPINCAAIPKDLIESEFFGHTKGAFTGAINDREGAVKLADGGTLFLDEIGETDPAMQSKLLRFLQNHTFRKVGGNKLEKTDIRIVCATNRDPQEMVQTGQFREDLYYRLHVIPIHMPPLYERGHDILDIASAFLWRYSTEENKEFESFSDEAEHILSAHHWPGNIREMQNLVRQIVVMNSGKIVTADMVLPIIRQRPAAAHNHYPTSITTQDNTGQIPKKIPGQRQSEHDHMLTKQIKPFLTQHDIRPLWIIEKDIIENAITVCKGNIPKAAALLEISPSTIYRKKTSWEKQ